MLIDLPTESDPVRVIEGDCLDVLRRLPDGCVDAVVTDPPYGLGESSLAWADRGYRRINEAWDGDVPTDWFAVAFRVLATGGTLLCFGSWQTFEAVLASSAAAGFTRRGVVVWDKVNTMPNLSKRGYQYTHELVLWATKGGGYHWHAAEQVRDIVRQTWTQPDRWHPSQKPIPLMAELIRRHAPPGGLVFDPFGGSGTTAVACLATGRRCLTVERDADYCERLRRRVADAIGRPLVGTDGTVTKPARPSLFA